MLEKIRKIDAWLDSSLWLLIISNLFAIVMIIANHVPLESVLIAYWMQSVIIGVFSLIRILCAKNFSTQGMKSNGQPIPPTSGGKIFIGMFFLVHYGIFHLVYFFFIVSFSSVASSGIVWADVMPIAGAFFVSHLFSFVRSFREQTTNQNLGKIMMAPYARIIPMHLVIFIAAAMGQFAIVPFLLLKTSVDVGGHIFKHASLQSDPNV